MIEHQLHEIVKYRTNQDQKFSYRYDCYKIDHLDYGLMSYCQDLTLDLPGMS